MSSSSSNSPSSIASFVANLESSSLEKNLNSSALVAWKNGFVFEPPSAISSLDDRTFSHFAHSPSAFVITTAFSPSIQSMEHTFVSLTLSTTIGLFFFTFQTMHFLSFEAAKQNFPFGEKLTTEKFSLLPCSKSEHCRFFLSSISLNVSKLKNSTLFSRPGTATTFPSNLTETVFMLSAASISVTGHTVARNFTSPGSS